MKDKNQHLLEALNAIHQKGVSDPAAQQLSQILADAGVDTPARFADVLLELVTFEHRQREAALPLRRSALWALAEDSQRSGPKITHRPPRAPFYFQGECMLPEDIRRFDGEPLYFTMLVDGSEARLVAYDNLRDLLNMSMRQEQLAQARAEIRAVCRDSLRSRAATPYGPGISLEWGGSGLKAALEEYADGSGSGGIDIQINPPDPKMDEPEASQPCNPGYVCCPRGAARPNPEAQFFEYLNFDNAGHWFWLRPGWQIARLTDRDISNAFLSGGRSWNDEISSVRGGDGMLLLYDAIDFGGSVFFIDGHPPKPVYSEYEHPICGPTIIRWQYTSPRQNFPDLGSLGWSDRVSSIQHFTSL